MLTNSGILLINKPKGLTSYDVVHQVKKTLGTKKVGHSGTLDPLATGLLVIGVNQGTKLLPLLPKAQKTYIAKVLIGIKTDTYDITGNVVETKEEVMPKKEEITKVLTSFLGESTQIPPMYSAKKINGKKAYELARKGIEVELKPQLINIDEIDLLAVNDKEFSFKVSVSKGTYIRSLIQDICNKLNIIATMSELERVSTDGFKINQATKINNINYDKLIKIDDYLKEKYKVKQTSSKNIKNGGKVKIENDEFPILFVDEENQAIGLYDKYQDNFAKPILML